MGYKHPTKNNYQQWISTYKKRLEKLTIQVGGNSPEYLLKASQLTAKIECWQKEIAEIEVREKEFNVIVKKVTTFFNIKSKWIARSTVPPVVPDYVKVLCKYALEAGIDKHKIAKYVGWKSHYMVSYHRSNFTRSFKTHPENKILWHKFKQFVKEHT